MSIPAVILLCIYAMSIGVSMMEHGTPKTGINSFWTTLVGVCINIGLLWWGGFFA